MNEKYEEYEKALAQILINSEINEYALEEAAMGHLKQGEVANVIDYLCELGYGKCKLNEMAQFAEGTTLDENRALRKKDTPDFYRRYFFNFCASCILDKMPSEKEIWGDDGMLKFDAPTRKYIDNLYPLFVRILDTEVQFVPHTPVTEHDVAAQVQDGMNIGIMLQDIMLKNLKAGDKVGKYLKKVKHVPYFTQNILDGEPKNARLRCDDVNSLDYKLAFISAFGVRGLHNVALIEQKSRRLYELEAE